MFVVLLLQSGKMNAFGNFIIKGFIFPDTIPLISSGNIIQKSIYSQTLKKRSGIYNSLWGEHYRELYSTPISVRSIMLSSLFGGTRVVDKANSFHGLYIEDKQERRYLLKPLGGSTSFLQSEFFQEMYNKADFENTYLDKFIGDAYTIINPYTFLVSDYLAKELELNSNNPRLFYIPAGTESDTIADGSGIQNRLVSIMDVPEPDSYKNIITTDSLLSIIQEDKSHRVNQQLYIRERVFDMLIGDWNKIPENWNWMSSKDSTGIIYQPIVIDRSHAFTKVDGFLFKQMLNVLTLGFISNYEEQLNDVKKFNSLGFTLDVALTAQSDKAIWLEEAGYLKNKLTDDVINNAFLKLPKAIQGKETEEIKDKLKKRRDALSDIAGRYYDVLQYNPVVIGTNSNDSIIINKYQSDSVRISIYDRQSNVPVFIQNYSKKHSKEIWLYGLKGDDVYNVEESVKNKLPVFLISGEGMNHYYAEPNHKVRIYGYNSEKTELDTLRNAKVILTDSEDIHTYNYDKTRYMDVSLSPWGVYDSDWGLTLGSFLTFTQYGIKRSPFSYQHRIGYNYLRGFMYKGTFPSYDAKRNIYIDAFWGSPTNFSNFFGFGNDTNGFKDKKKDYNRVKVAQHSIASSLHTEFIKDQNFILSIGLEAYKVKYEDDKYLNHFYEEDNSIFKRKYFLDLSVGYEIDKELSSLIPVFTSSISTGWKLNLGDVCRNFTYTKVNMAFNFRLTDRILLATNMKGKMIYNSKYDFYHSASTELRGYRDSRFIGQYSYYQYSDLRIDMGKIQNPFTPLKYGLFTGFDFGRVWLPEESSKKWHTSYGGGGWLTIINKITTKYSFFGSGDSFRFMFELGMGF